MKRLSREWIPSPNYSSRQDNDVRLIVVHVMDGTPSYQMLGDFLSGPQAGISLHAAVDNLKRGWCGTFVRPEDSAWANRQFNRISVTGGLCVPSNASRLWSGEQWMDQAVMMKNLAMWIREESDRFGIPPFVLSPEEARAGGRGICQHGDLMTDHNPVPDLPLQAIAGMAQS